MGEKALISLHPVGWVANGVTGPKHQGWEEVESEIVIEPELAPALKGLEDYSHILILFWLDRVSPEEKAMLQFRPHDREDLPLLGAFATRSQRRPNPIGLTVVKLLGREGNRLRVMGLDALDGTPVLDIKPYSHHDYVEGFVGPEWLRRARS